MYLPLVSLRELRHNCAMCAQCERVSFRFSALSHLRFGGYSGFTWLNDFHSFNFDTSTWQAVPFSPQKPSNDIYSGSLVAQQRWRKFQAEVGSQRQRAFDSIRLRVGRVARLRLC